MKTYSLLTAVLLLTSTIAHGRFFQIWSFQQLFDEADLVMIASIEEPTRRVGTTANLPGESMTFDNVHTRFKKRAILKGEFEPERWRYDHHWFTEDTNVLISPPSFKKFDPTDVGKAYLVFLKKDATGELIPVSGQKQPTSSFIETHPDGAMMFEHNESSREESEPSDEKHEKQPATSDSSETQSESSSAVSESEPAQVHVYD